MRGWKISFLGARRRDHEVEAEAQRDARRAATEALEQQIEALKAALADRDDRIIRLTARLRVAEVVQHTPQWMAAKARAARVLDPEITSVVPADLVRRAAAKGRHR